MVYFSADAEVVKNTTKTSSEYKGTKALGDESYDPGKLLLETGYSPDKRGQDCCRTGYQGQHDYAWRFR
jgi:hypothetical protein